MVTAREDNPVPTILVVDDELGYREGIRRILTRKGLPVKTAASGLEALQLAEVEDFPIVLADLKMPEVDGFELIERLRIMRPQTICIVVSAFATIESAVQTTKMGAFDFVVKPFVPDDLMVVVNRALETWRLAREAERLRREREAHLLELAAEKSRLRTILQSMGDGLMVVNIDGQVVLDNPVARRLLRRVGAESLTCPLQELLPSAKVGEEVTRMLSGEGQEASVLLEVHLPAIEGGDAERYLRATLAPVRDEQAVLGAVVMLSDITEAKAFERMRNLFVSMVAHEIKAPLGAVEGYLNLIRSGSMDGQPDKVKQILSRCMDRTTALLSLVQDLLEITRRDAGRQERRLEALDLGELLGSLVEFHRNDAQARGITLSLNVESALPPAKVDRHDMERVLVNLLSNAIKYNRDQGQVQVGLSRRGAALCIEVRDTGIGMSPAEVRRLGEEFFRAKNSKTLTITGTGLGVALVKKIIDSYNGALEVESVPDQGSTFRVLLPVITGWGDMEKQA